MTQEQIKQASEVFANLSSEQKESFKSIFMTELAKTDHLGEISTETLEKVSGGDLISGIRRFLGYWIDKLDGQ